MVSPTTSQYTPLVPIQHTNIVIVWRRNARKLQRLINPIRNSTLQLSSTSGHQDHPAVWRRPTIQKQPQDITSGRLYVMCVHTAQVPWPPVPPYLEEVLAALHHIRSSITDTNQNSTLSELCTRGIAAHNVWQTAPPPPSRLAKCDRKPAPSSPTHTRHEQSVFSSSNVANLKLQRGEPQYKNPHHGLPTRVNTIQRISLVNIRRPRTHPNHIALFPFRHFAPRN